MKATDPQTIAWALLGIALLMAGLSVPLARGKVPMNHFYGVRFPQSFKSDRHWYAINRYGGKALSAASIPIFMTALYGLAYPKLGAWYPPTCIALSILSLTTACVASYRAARRIDRELS